MNGKPSAFSLQISAISLQPSAVSFQALREASQHSADFLCLPPQRTQALRFGEVEILRQDEMRLHLAGRTQGNPDKTKQFSIAAAS